MSFWQALEIYPIGLAIASVFWIPAYRFVLRPLSRSWKEKPWRMPALGVLALGLLVLPYADELWIAWRFSSLCEDAGVHVTRMVEVDGFLDDTSRSAAHVKEQLIRDPQAIEQFDRSGYRFKESMLYNGKVWHLERVTGGLQLTILDHPTARYVYKFADPNHDVPVGLKTIRTEEIVVDSGTGEIIGRDTRYKRYPGWLEGLWIRFLGSGLTICPDPGKGPPREHLPAAALRPLSKQ